VWGSLDGKDYKVFGQIDPVPNHGLRTRVLNVGGMPARFVRVGEGVGDSFYSISEVRGLLPGAVAVSARHEGRGRAGRGGATQETLDYWDNDASARWELILAMPRHLVPVVGTQAQRRGPNGGEEARAQRAHRGDGRAGLSHLLQLRLLPLPQLHPRLGHLPLLHRVQVLQRDQLRAPVRVRGHRRQRRAEPAPPGRAAQDDQPAHQPGRNHGRHPGPSRALQVALHPERWESLKHDLRYFRTLENARRWDDAQTDHGYNGTPVWNIMGTILTNLGPASRTQVLALDSIDCILVVLLSLMIWWAFGWRTLTVALIAFSTNFPSRWYWTGGSLLRWDWLFWMVAAVCLLKKERFFYAGMCLAYSTLLRIFPGFMFVAPLIAAVYHYVKHRELESASCASSWAPRSRWRSSCLSAW
jgi:hypothetical protein